MIENSTLNWGPSIVGNKFLKYAYTLHGCTLRIYRGSAESKQRPFLVKHKIVSPELIELLYKIEDGLFDQTLWDKLTEDEMDLLGYLAHVRGLNNRELTLAIAKSSAAVIQRLKMIENNVKLGNLSQLLVSEYIEIIDRLVNSGQMLAQKGSAHKNAMKRTLKAQQRDNDSVSRRRRI